MNRKEEIIKEQRTFEATRKNLMGINGKIGIVCKYLGQPIQKEGSSMFMTSEMDDPWAIEDEDEDMFDGTRPFDMNKLPEMDEDEVSYTIGYVFDGLSRGIHIEIKYIEDRRELNCFYKGYEVYREAGGDLEIYVPSEEWEGKVEYLFDVAKKAEKKRMQEGRDVMKEVASQKQAEYLENLKNRWGFK